MLGDLVGSVRTWLKESKLAKMFAKTCVTKNSFSASTLVLLADGTTKPIETLAVGDRVATADPVEGGTSSREITYLYVNDDQAFTDLTVAADGQAAVVIHTTQEHPFWSVTRSAWTSAGRLAQGEQLQTADGTVVHVLDRTNFTGAATMYNLTVDTIHTYYVLAGNTPVLVHNCGDIALGKQTVGGDDMALDIFGMERGAQTYKEWSGSGAWHEQLRGFISDGKTRIHVNLDGIDDPISYAASGRGVDPTDVGGRGFTRWEMYQLSQNSTAWNRVTWYRNGRTVANPFGG